ncbi:MAG: WecB/TagA/CpsF family glycosyltransferase [Acidobacteriota bacterium]|nr:WecB/TagA/CpsF family glycosyltransferase [Acidobacteriota bacterium]
MPNGNLVETVALLGVPISNVTMDEAIDYIDASIRRGGFHQFATANADFLRNAISDPEMQQILFGCDLVVPDGMPLLWISRLLNCPLRDRVCGVDMVPRLAELAVRRGYSVFLLGAKELVSRKAAENLLRKYPDLEICGRYSPPNMPIEQMDHEQILRRIDAARPDILLVAFGNPKQEKWIAMHRDRLAVPACIGIGGTLDFIAGAIPRAPKWMRGVGLEWFYRCLQEPLRLSKRYVSDAATLARHVPRQFVPHALQSRRKAGSEVFAQSAEEAIVISVHGNLYSDSLRDFVAIAGSAVQTGMNIVVNLSPATFLGIDALGELIRLHSQLSPFQYMYLAGLRPHQIRVLQGAKLDSCFKLVSSVEDAVNRGVRAQERNFRVSTDTWMDDPAASTRVQVKLVMLFDICRRVAVAGAGEFVELNTPVGHRRWVGFGLQARASAGFS